jgi:hypothetical protein
MLLAMSKKAREHRVELLLGLPEFFLLRGFGGLGRTPAYLKDVLIAVAKCRARAQKAGAPACDK